LLLIVQEMLERINEEPFLADGLRSIYNLAVDAGRLAPGCGVDAPVQFHRLTNEAGEVCGYNVIVRCEGETFCTPWGTPGDSVRSAEDDVYVRRRVVTLLGRWLRQAKLAAGGQDQGRPCRLQQVSGRVLLDDKEISLGLTAERRADALCYLGHLIRVGGDWISDSEVNAAETILGSGRAGVRWDRIRDGLPEDVRNLIETHKRKGSRLRPEAWHK
jgi:hypothetical protein